MPYYCTVPRCTSMAGKAKNVSFHQFPRDEELARLWNEILKRGKPYTKYSKVCSLHFKPQDYTITSVGKNKGQWRTLRKDAVPSQNLPSETPAPYSRKQWETWNQNSGAPNVIDPSLHQQMAQAIYMQTMLAMQAAGTEPSNQQDGPSPDFPSPHSSNHEDILKGKQTNTDCTYRCAECAKCFKDPDVFILHKRSHTKEIKNNGIEKENFNMNLTLRSNPILANLLKTNNEVSLDPNTITMESLLMSALAANMDYLRNFSTVKDDRDCDALNHDRGDLEHARSDLNHARSDLNHARSDLNHARSDLNHDRSDSNNDMGDLNRVRSDLNDRNVELHLRSDLDQSKADSYPKGDLDPARGDRHNIDDPNHVREDISFDKGHLSRRNSLNETKGEFRCDLKHYSGVVNHPRDDENNSTSQYHPRDDINPTGDLSSVIGPIRYAMNITSKELNEKNRSYNGNFYRERYFSAEFENVEKNSNGVNHNSLDNDRLRSNCDNDLNESMDSNSLVIDESV